MPNNSILVIKPYVWNGAWVFDDESVGLVHEALISGVPEVIERLTRTNDIENPEKGFKLYFSANAFPQYQIKADWVKEEYGGNWYEVSTDQWKDKSFYHKTDKTMMGWLCPALFKYFEKAPKNLYIKASQLPTS